MKLRVSAAHLGAEVGVVTNILWRPESVDSQHSSDTDAYGNLEFSLAQFTTLEIASLARLLLVGSFQFY
jgi:hypothetical protein